MDRLIPSGVLIVGVAFCAIEPQDSLDSNDQGQSGSMGEWVSISGTTRCPALFGGQCTQAQGGHRLQTHGVNIWVPLQEGPELVAAAPRLPVTLRTELTFDQLTALAPKSLEDRIHDPGGGRAGELKITTQRRLNNDEHNSLEWEVHVTLTADALSLNGEATYPFVMTGSAVRPQPVALSVDALANQLGCATFTPRITFHDCVQASE